MAISFNTSRSFGTTKTRTIRTKSTKKNNDLDELKLRIQQLVVESDLDKKVENIITPVIHREAPKFGQMLTLPSEVKITMIYDRAQCAQLFSLIESGQVGIDCEWKPTKMKGEQQNRVALMQLADKRSVYLIDTIALADCPVLDKVLNRVFKSVTLLNFGGHNDFEIIERSFPKSSFYKGTINMVDVQKTYRFYTNGYNDTSLSNVA